MIRCGLHPILRPRLLLLILALFGLTACGVRFVDSFNGTELFRKLELTGDFLPGKPLTVTVTVTQAYPLPVEVACMYEDSSDLTKDQKKIVFPERATTVGTVTLPASPGTAPGDKKKVEPQEYSFEFTVDQPGDYFIACLTPAATENGIGTSFTVDKP